MVATAEFCCQQIFGGHSRILLSAEFCRQQNFAAAAIPCHTLAPFHFLELINSLITIYKHNRCQGNTSRNQSHNTDLSIYGPQAGWLHYHDGDNGGGSGARRFALCHDDDVATDDALCSGHPVWLAPGELKRDSGSMSLGTSLLWGSHCGSNHTGDNGGGRWFALNHDDDVATNDALCSGHPVRHAPGQLKRDSGSMSLGTSLLWGSHCGAILLETMVAVEDLLWVMMMTLPLMMPFVQGILFVTEISRSQIRLW